MAEEEQPQKKPRGGRPKKDKTTPTTTSDSGTMVRTNPGENKDDTGEYKYVRRLPNGSVIRSR